MTRFLVLELQSKSEGYLGLETQFRLHFEAVASLTKGLIKGSLLLRSWDDWPWELGPAAEPLTASEAAHLLQRVDPSIVPSPPPPKKAKKAGTEVAAAFALALAERDLALLRVRLPFLWAFGVQGKHLIGSYRAIAGC